ncbi:GNAT family N-acetyltransferase [Mycobacterium sp.]|uniref:GNAT family N-acetyltransferase, cg3035/Rv0428c family n=1 Tax=Mycobacterium sp. TaxID=1785 RepID=UPI0025F57804|nr:GNAT family N-acetyltransferase [Mycobacterium sp.]MBW0015511.1 GNAT family N-acetyltransferase [Mycobacterium sp.]
MVSWPEPGTRVTVRYRRPAGSVPPLTDAVGHLLTVDPVVRVRTKTGAVVEFAPGDAVALRTLTDAPLRTSGIRALEHALAAAWPGDDRAWLDGWLVRAGQENRLVTNSAVPLDVSAHTGTIPAIHAWYERRGLTPWLAIPDRLLSLRAGAICEHTERLLVRDVSSSGQPHPAVALSAGPPTAALGGELMFGSHAGGAVVRAAVTDAPDGTRWVGLSAIRASDQRVAMELCEALSSWGAVRGATRAYLLADEPGAAGLAESMGFRLHHRRRYFRTMANV